jgi:FkbM family methyltransferase
VNAAAPDGGTLLTGIVRGHSAVADALVTVEPAGDAPTAWIVPDERHARLLHLSVQMQNTGRLGGLSWHEPADGLRVAGLNRGETDFLYREIFSADSYFPNGFELPENAVVVDVGANIGMFTLRVAFESPGTRIVAIEAVSELAEAIRINAELYGIAVDVVCAAAGRDNSESEFTLYPQNSVMSGQFADRSEDLAVLKGYLLAAPGSAETAQVDRLAESSMTAQRRRVPVVTLTEVAALHELDHIDLLKIDVEKAELEVLAGIADALWPRIARVVMEVHDLDGRVAHVVEVLRSKGFDVASHRDPRLALTPCHFITAHRRGMRAPVAVGGARVPGGGGPTQRELERDLRHLIAGRSSPVAASMRFVLVADLRRVPERALPPVLGATRRTAELARAWSAMFGAEAVRPEADFFELGGTSIMAIQLLDAVTQRLGEDVLTPEIIFAAGTLGAIAAAMEPDAPHGHPAGYSGV